MQRLDTAEWKPWLFDILQGLQLLEKRNINLDESILAPIINLVYGNFFTNSACTDAVCFSFKDGYFPPFKHWSSANVSRSNNQSAPIQKAIIHKSVNSFVARKSVSVISCNFIRPDFASKPVCNVPTKPVKCKVACEPVFNVCSKPLKSKVACKLVCNVPNKPAKSKVPCKTIFELF